MLRLESSIYLHIPPTQEHYVSPICYTASVRRLFGCVYYLKQGRKVPAGIVYIINEDTPKLINIADREDRARQIDDSE